MKFEDLSPLFIFKTESDGCWDTLEIKGSLGFQAITILIDASTLFELLHVDVRGRELLL